MSEPLPTRPRLADHALARRHVVDDAEHVVIFDQRTGQVVLVSPQTWEALAVADGTRDVEGIRLAARRAGVVTSADEIARTLQQLHALGLVAGPSERRGPARVVIERTTPPSRPIEPLPRFDLRCDRSGACCRNYATVLMTTEDVERARAWLPDHRVGSWRGERLFLPVAGSEPSALLAPAHRNGACGYLEPEGTCAVHRAGGLAAKPVGCAVFPTVFTDDGISVRASVKTECACVLDSATATAVVIDEPWLDPTWQTAGDLPPLVAVQRLHERLALSAELTLPTAQVRAFVEAWFAAPTPGDVAAAAWGMAATLQARGPDAGLEAWSQSSPVAADEVAPWVSHLYARARRRAHDNAQWRSEADAVRSGVEWLAAAAAVLTDVEALAELLAAEPEDTATEHFYLRAAAHGYGMFDRPLTDTLRDRAVRIWLSRVMRWLAPGARDAARRQPLARVDALLRGYGIGNYVDEVLTSCTAASPASRRD